MPDKTDSKSFHRARWKCWKRQTLSTIKLFKYSLKKNWLSLISSPMSPPSTNTPKLEKWQSKQCSASMQQVRWALPLERPVRLSEVPLSALMQYCKRKTWKQQSRSRLWYIATTAVLLNKLSKAPLLKTPQSISSNSWIGWDRRADREMKLYRSFSSPWIKSKRSIRWF